MRKRMISILFGILFGGAVTTAQEIPAEVTNAFKNGNAESISSFLGAKVELVLSNHSKEYDKKAARQAMNEFFSLNKVTGFKVNHQGGRDESKFIVGTLSTLGGNYRINCYFKKMDNQYLIHQIRIDKTNE